MIAGLSFHVGSNSHYAQGGRPLTPTHSGVRAVRDRVPALRRMIGCSAGKDTPCNTPIPAPPTLASRTTQVLLGKLPHSLAPLHCSCWPPLPQHTRRPRQQRTPLKSRLC